MTIAEFIKSAGLSMNATWTDHNPSMEDSATMDHWRCTIRSGKSRMSLVFSMGVGHNGKQPELADVLDCLASDASAYPATTSGFRRLTRSDHQPLASLRSADVVSAAPSIAPTAEALAPSTVVRKIGSSG